ncbi:hypothetical protein GCM10011611_31350 [Aliidongia dinghuensis]|uniref:HTH araC/xylS-type domain-containing protein n=1 Tax=Aliidongia dinghuensis TaxID=1867774 RepID=A0A8J3E2P0_9PROT|nr:AraC family transcriptional regulator [Aliidongia dinghuensis]GGF22979.1 hypothetical protein GCM10011611_31350 [Aliidongia dinghuensis]
MSSLSTARPASDLSAVAPSSRHDAASGFPPPQASSNLAQAIVNMLRDGSAVVTMSLPNFPISDFRGSAFPTSDGARRDFALPEHHGPQSFGPWPAANEGAAAELRDGAGARFAMVGELKRQGSSLAFVVQLVRTDDQPAPPTSERLDRHPNERSSAGLPKWRLKRAIAHIDANIENSISVGDLAKAAGLSATYFAAQFRLATGLPPHEFIMRRRISRAQAILLETRQPLIEVALSVGFQTQAHFTNVFRKCVGTPPSRWRRHHMDADDGARRRERRDVVSAFWAETGAA